ncbi:hypothetical protein BZL29_4331 [Mycobacterium kansasii]|uniref:Uncharacterized protein n=1 Tax=Mycobacterium kansasii TaxID=1768 RepID=A0A1V3X628_MYCKA|nr:hypothetical protein BZL29_4331 [Mycobacterium kansasii]
MFLDEVEHGRAGTHERFHQCVVHRSPRLRAQVLQGLGHRQLTVGTAVMSRNPGYAARDSGGPADGRRLLEHRYRCAGDRCGQCGGEPGTAAAEHHDIEFLIPPHARRPFSSAVWTTVWRPR